MVFNMELKKIALMAIVTLFGVGTYHYHHRLPHFNLAHLLGQHASHASYKAKAETTKSASAVETANLPVTHYEKSSGGLLKLDYDGFTVTQAMLNALIASILTQMYPLPANNLQLRLTVMATTEGIKYQQTILIVQK